MQKRTSLMVAYDILKIAKGVSTVTVLVYQGNLNFKVVKRWLAKLIAKGLIAFYDGPTKTWKTTEKGLRFMDAMERVLCFWEDENIARARAHRSPPINDQTSRRTLNE